ncbi:ABC transporter permease [Mycolicibacterium vaccae]|uniref:ABC transporter permease n=1 Tax=Mycolicibacterium vaccae TaxID=1810 RepID=UPI003CE7558F
MTDLLNPETRTAPDANAVKEPSWLRSKIGMRVASVLFGVAMLVGWDLLVRTGTVDEIILPYPHLVVAALADELRNSVFWMHFQVTTIETLVGFGIGAVVGFGIGAALGMSAWVRAVLFPYVVAFQGLPKVVLAPLFVTALGFGIWSKIAMAVALAFFPVLLNTMVGILSVDRDQARLLQMYRATAWQKFTKLTLPGAAPLISAGLKASLTFALIGAIVGEFVGASKGLGFLLNTYAYQLRIPQVWAVMAVLALLGVALYWLIELVDRKVIFWTGERDMSTR